MLISDNLEHASSYAPQSDFSDEDHSAGWDWAVERLKVLALVGLFYAVTCLLYRDIVAPVYFFGGFVYDPASSTIIPHTLLVVSALFLNVRPKRMADVFVLLSYIFLLIPATALSVLQNSDTKFLAAMYVAVFSVKYITKIMNRYLQGFEFANYANFGFQIKFAIIYIFTIGVLFYLAVHVGGSFNLSFLNVYDYRLDFNESLDFPLNYLLPIAAGACVGFCTAVSVDQKNWVIAASVILMGVMFFGFSSHKAFLFYPVFAVAGYFLVKWNKGGILLVSGIAAIGVATLLSTGVTANILSSSFANRLIFIPAQIHFVFYEEFTQIGPQLWAESKFSLGLVKPSLPVPAVFYIGEKMTGLIDVGANTGWIANGYMNAGYAGIAFYAVLLSVIIVFIEYLGDLYGQAFVTAAFIIPIYSIINSIDLLAGLLTGGLMAVIVIFLALVQPVRGDEWAV